MAIRAPTSIPEIVANTALQGVLAIPLHRAVRVPHRNP